jgi:CSLREA domain-containing protein
LSAFAALGAAPAAFGATISVSTEGDVLNGNDGKCSLREAVIAANGNAASGPAAGECGTGSGADTIELPAGNYTRLLAGNNEGAAATGDLDITSDMTIHGAGAATTTIDASQKDRVLDIAGSITVSIEGVTITGGVGQGGGTPAGNGFPTAAPGIGGARGGGILNAGTLTLTASVVKDNLAGDGGAGGGASGSSNANGTAGTGGAGGDGGSGGGIYSNGNLTIVRTTITGNRSGSGGAGGTASGGNNTNPVGTGGTGSGGKGGNGGLGGGIYGATGALTITDSTISGNTTGRGGKGGNASGGNGALAMPGGNGGKGGAAVAGNGGVGGAAGAIASEVPTTITSSTISGNTAGDGGDGGTGQGGPGGVSAAGSNSNGGGGGNADGGDGGNGGAGGAAAVEAPSFDLLNVTVTGNHSGNGGTGGNATGGVAQNGSSNGNGNGGNGGNGIGGAGGTGSAGGAFVGGNFSLSHGTIALNGAGTGAGGGVGAGTAGGSKGTVSGSNGGTGNSVNGAAGAAGTGGGIAGISATPLTSTILASNTPSNCAGGPFTDGGGNLDFPDSPCPGDAADPQLAALADNGGPALTMALPIGSPAIDRVAVGASCRPKDQRGATRPGGGACDAGAYEVAPPVAATSAAQGVTATGATLAGSLTPNFRTTTYHFEFGLTTNHGATTPNQSAAAGLSAVDVTAAVAGLTPSTTYHYRLVATSDEGSSSGQDMTFTTPAGTGPANARPVLTAVSMTNTVFAVGPKATAVAAKARRGTTFRYTLSEAATVRIAISRARPGRRKGKRCVKPTRKLRKAKRCTRYLRSGTLTRASKAGKNRVAFSGRIGRRALKPGRYRAVLRAADAAGKRSLAKTLKFRVVR